MQLAPIALFVYNRPEHTRQTIQYLKENTLAPLSHLFVFSDGAKSEEQRESVNAVRACIRQIDGFESLSIIERPKNFGLADSIVDGVTKLCNDFGKVIVLEDDLITSPYFLQYMNEALNFYEKNEGVVSVDAYMYPIKDLPETFFLKDPGCWGWATWQRGWALFEPDGSKLLKQLQEKKLESAFDYGDSYPYTEMLMGQVLHKNNSWAVRWYASIFLENKLTLHVGKSLAFNIGNDNSGTHGGKTELYDVQLNAQPVRIEKIPLLEDSFARKEIAAFLKSTKQSRLKLVFNRIARTLKTCTLKK